MEYSKGSTIIFNPDLALSLPRQRRHARLRSMRPVFFLLAFFSVLCVFTFGCTRKTPAFPERDEQEFSRYWYNGQAEISSFKVSQFRYGSNHDGQSVLVFVTEDFSRRKHVKLERPETASSEAVKVMKMNASEEYITGLYKYNMMNSVFTPVDLKTDPHSLKVTSGIQEWCGQSFIQADWKNNRYDIRQMSYFEEDGDQDISLAMGWLEDELWTKIRIDPNALPVGDTKMIPGFTYLRLSHVKQKIYKATTSLTRSPDHFTYEVHYPELHRTLAIQFEADFPNKILGWKEINGTNEITTGQILTTIRSDYWNHNQPADTLLRSDLKLR